MSRTMYDACDPTHIPADAAMVAYYIEGQCAWPPQQLARFPNAVKVPIATVAQPPRGTVLDVEAGDSSPDLAPGWCAARRAAGVDPSVYCNVSTWPTVRAAFAAHQVAEPHYWIAAWDHIAVLPSGAVAKQYVNEQPPGCDTSVVADYWPGVDPSPVTPTQGEPEAMYLFVAPMPAGVWCLHAGHYFHITDPESEAAFATVAGHAPQPITDAQHLVLQQTYPNDATVAGGGPIATGGAL